MNIGHNNPPADPFVDGLKERARELLDSMASIEVTALTLPDAVDIKTDADAQIVLDAIGDFKAHVRQAEALRKAEKDDFLRLGRLVDEFFTTQIKAPIQTHIAAAEASLVPYLTAKKEAAAALARAEAAKAEEARLARLAAIRAAEAEAAKEREAAEAAAAALRDETVAVDIEATADDMRAATAASLAQEQEADRIRAEQIAEEERAAAAARAAARAPKGPQIVVYWTPLSVDYDKVRAQSGLIGPYLTDAVISGALDRAGSSVDSESALPAFDGVVWQSHQTTKARARRS